MYIYIYMYIYILYIYIHVIYICNMYIYIIDWIEYKQIPRHFNIISCASFAWVDVGQLLKFLLISA